MLVQVALIVFALCAMLSLVIDIGYTRVTQAQLQNAADAAALEGLRRRNVGVVTPAGQTVDDPFASDCLRRASANRVVRRTFDDDLDPLNGDPDYQFGAGPVVELTDGVTSAHALQTISVPETHVYKPDPQMNQQNQVYGDMVSGRFCYTTDPAASEGSVYEALDIVCTEPQRGSGAYARNDFNPSAAAPQPPPALGECPAPDDTPPAPWPVGGRGSLNTVSDSAFLVRLRRSNEFTDSAGQVEPTVASSGPALPLLPGKGTTIQGDDPSLDYSVRRDGLTVRATAIAAVRPALHVGLPRTAPAQPGVTPFALADTFVQTLTVARQVTINPATGAICAGTTCTGVALAASAGRFVDNLADPTRTRWRTISTVGQALPAPFPVACALTATIAGYGPVYSLLASGTNRIIGFTRITLAPDPARPGDACAKLVTRAASVVAPGNATASLTGGLPLPPTAQPAEVRQLMDRHFQRNGGLAYAPVLVPAVVR